MLNLFGPGASQLHSWTECLPNLVWTCEAHGSCNFVNQHCVEYTGVPAENLLGWGWLDHIHPGDRNQSRQQWLDCVGSGRDYDATLRLRGKDGVYRPFYSTGRPLRSTEGDIKGWIGTHTELLDGRVEESTLQLVESNLRLAKLTSRLQDAQSLAGLGVWSYDANSEEVLWSPEVYQILGQDPEQKPPSFEDQSEIFSTKSYQALSLAVAAALHQGKPYELELEVLRPNGQVGWIRARGELSRVRHERDCLLGTVQDITELKRAASHPDPVRASKESAGLSPLRTESARHLGRGVGLGNWIIYPLLAILIGMASDLPQQHPEWLLFVITSTTLLGLPRWQIGRKLMTAPPARLPTLLKLYTASVFSIAICWSIFSSLVVYQCPGEWVSLLTVMVSAGIVASSTAWLNPNLLLQVGFIMLTVVPQSLFMALSGGRPEAIAGLTAGLFAIFVTRTGVINHRQFVSWLVSNRDLTLAHEQEKSQRARVCLLEERWSYAFQGSGEGVWDWDVASGQVYYSDRFREMLNLPEVEQMFGLEDWFERIVGEDIRAVRANLQEHLSESTPLFSCENRVNGPDGIFWSLARGKVVARDGQGVPLRVVGTCANIDQQKQLQIQLSLARNLETVGQLAAGIAHEINTPIQYVTNNFSYLRETCEQLMASLESGIPPEDLDFLREEIPLTFVQTAEGLAHITKIVSAMREFTHGGQGEKRLVNLHHLLQISQSMCAHRLKLVAELETDFCSDLPEIAAVQSELSQVWLNLLMNAADAVAERQRQEPDLVGKIRVATRLCSNHVEIQLEDNGCGIEAPQAERIFDPFFTTKEVGKGTGQGLTLCRSIVAHHGGEIRFTSRPGQGTTFVVCLPLY